MLTKNNKVSRSFSYWAATSKKKNTTQKQESLTQQTCRFLGAEIGGAELALTQLFAEHVVVP